ncbi:WYL domain-containing protein [Pollutibacter soli]|uniref:helix-turn-helix transcriptional regulator n=1 Tax=Pollutibacter soli TaxID=3034157 RepID=UPI00301410FE
MAINKLALIRYRTIDQCLSNRRRKWTLDDLMDKVSAALYEAEGIKSGVSRRTIQADIQLMRSDKLGYNAPIVVREKKYYTYEVPEFSINSSRVTGADIDKMNEIVSVLKQLSGFSYFDEMNDIIARLENSVGKTRTNGRSLIQMEGNTLLRGIGHIAPLYQAIKKQLPLLINYKSFTSDEAHQQVYFPYLLKEYRNRWFLICKSKKENRLVTLALDRITGFEEMAAKNFVPYNGIDFERYFAETIGVTKGEKDRAHRVILSVDKRNAPYVLTKPLHSSQTIIKEDAAGIIIRLDVTLNFELDREILGFGEGIMVLAPKILQNRIARKLKNASAQYNSR